MNTGIGEMIVRLRQEKGYKQEQLCIGLCSVAELARIERNQVIPGHFQLDFIFGRLGKSADKLEYILKKEVYILYELRYKIQTNILHLEFEKAEEVLKEYETKKQKNSVYHRQFILKQQAQIAWMRGEEIEKVLEYTNQAIKETMPLADAWKRGMALSSAELKLLLFRWEICKGTKMERPLQEVREIMEYSEKSCTDLEELVNIYPYAVLLLIRDSELGEDDEFKIYILNRAFELLRNRGRLQYLSEIMEQYEKYLKNRGQNEKIETLHRERSTLLALEKKFNVHYEKYRLFQSMNREFDLDYEIIRTSREASGKSQEEAAEDICTRETLSRIERGKNSPTDKTLKKLTERLERTRSRIHTVITTEEFEIIELKQEFISSNQRLDEKKSEELLKQLEEKLDITFIENQQYILAEKIKQEIRKERLPLEIQLKKLQNVLKMSFNGSWEKIFENKLTATEINILNQIAMLYYLEDKNKAISIYENLLQQYEKSLINPVFHFSGFGILMGNLTSCLEETGKVDKAMEYGEKRIKMLLELGKGGNLGRTLTTMACALEQKEDEICKQYFMMAANMLHLMKMDYQYKLVKEYIDSHYNFE